MGEQHGEVFFSIETLRADYPINVLIYASQLNEIVGGKAVQRASVWRG